MREIDIQDIIKHGQIKNFDVTPSFIYAYYSHPQLSEDRYYTFTFITASQTLLKVDVQTKRGLVQKRDKSFFPLIEVMIKKFIGEL
jgi:hypothetical protein